MNTFMCMHIERNHGPDIYPLLKTMAPIMNLRYKVAQVLWLYSVKPQEDILPVCRILMSDVIWLI